MILILMIIRRILISALIHFIILFFLFTPRGSIISFDLLLLFFDPSELWWWWSSWSPVSLISFQTLIPPFRPFVPDALVYSSFGLLFSSFSLLLSLYMSSVSLSLLFSCHHSLIISRHEPIPQFTMITMINLFINHFLHLDHHHYSHVWQEKKEGEGESIEKKTEYRMKRWERISISDIRCKQEKKEWWDERTWSWWFEWCVLWGPIINSISPHEPSS